MFKGENLTNLRILHGLSRKKLAEIVGVTEQAIWQFENNYTPPKLETILILKSIFQVKSNYFYTDDLLKQKQIDNNINVMNIAYRSNVVHTVSKTRTEAKHLEFLDVFIDDLTSSITHPSLKLVQLQDKVIHYLNETNDSRLEQIANVAKTSRKTLELDNQSNENLMFLIEKSGAFIFEKAIGEEVDAYSLWTNRNRPYIMLGNLKKSAVRRNFDLAHELGHLLLHNHIEFGNIDRKEHRQIEKEANTFAGAFLLPAEAFTTDMYTIDRLTNPDAYIQLIKKWHVSIQVMAYRAENLNILDSKSHRNFYAALHRKGYLKQEPLDNQIRISKPTKVKSMIDFISINNLISLQSFQSDHWKVELSFLSKLTGIEIQFFEKYIHDYKTDLKTNVTELANYQ